ncbi:MAG TPA: 4Fe-4S ferredoxin [Deltaproteobacteria bacterium]|nr:4Fe-4S ferredoxin [Deltaproteobacteria bacterium]
MKIKRKIIEIDEERCSGCGQCAEACAEGAITMVDGKARLMSENFCDGLGACIGECPEGALRIIEKESEEFDPAAVEEHLKSQTTSLPLDQDAPACGCPSQGIQIFPSRIPEEGSSGEGARPNVPSALTHWPVQIRLIPPTAPFLQKADLLIAADCTALAYAGFHRDLLPGKVVMLGCPKFDDVEDYLGRFVEIFKSAGIRSITVVDMEVPCCSKLPLLVRKAVSLSGVGLPVEEIVISRKGDMLQKRKVV